MHQALSQCFTCLSLFEIHGNYNFHFTKGDIEPQLKNCQDHEAESGEPSSEREVRGGLLSLGVNHGCPVQMLLLPSLMAQRQPPKLEKMVTVALQCQLISCSLFNSFSAGGYQNNTRSLQLSILGLQWWVYTRQRTCQL